MDDDWNTITSKSKRKYSKPKRSTTNNPSYHGHLSKTTAPASGHSLDQTNDTMEHTDASQDSVYRDSVQSHKKSKTDDRPSGQNNNQNELLFLLIKTTDLEDPLCLTKIDPWRLGEELEHIIGGDVKAAKTTRAGNILVGVENQQQFDEVLKIETF